MKSWLGYTVVALAFFAYKTATDVDRDGSGAIVGDGNVDAFNVQVGDCFNDAHQGEGEYEVSDVPGMPCSAPHDNETYAVFDLGIDSYPGGDTMGELAYDACFKRFESFVGRDCESSTLDINIMYPSQESWTQNDHEVVCAVYDMEANQLIGSAKGRSL